MMSFLKTIFYLIISLNGIPVLHSEIKKTNRYHQLLPVNQQITYQTTNLSVHLTLTTYNLLLFFSHCYFFHTKSIIFAPSFMNNL